MDLWLGCIFDNLNHIENVLLQVHTNYKYIQIMVSCAQCTHCNTHTNLGFLKTYYEMKFDAEIIGGAEKFERKAHQ